MADNKEVLHERLYVTVPGTDRLRKSSAGTVRRLVGEGWREVARQQRPEHPEYLMARFERTGHLPLKARLPKGPQEQPRFERRPRGQGPGGPPGRGGRRGR